ncbi:MAG: single-stranded DNA-binding protein [Promethearchaeota archaeon]
MSFYAFKEMKIEDLKPFDKGIEVVFKIVEKGKPREILSRRSGEIHNVCNITVADSTGAILLTLWNNDIGLVEERKNYRLLNGYIKVFRNSMRLNKGKYGIISEAEEPIDEVNTENNLSDKFVEERRQHRYNRYRYNNYGDSYYRRSKNHYRNRNEW